MNKIWNEQVANEDTMDNPSVPEAINSVLKQNGSVEMKSLKTLLWDGGSRQSGGK